MSLDLRKLCRILAVAGSSDQEGEALAAVRKAAVMLRQGGATWADLFALQDEVRVATEAAAMLLAENQILRAELDQLRSAPGKSVTVWSDVNTATSRTRRGARWALDLHARGQVWLNPRFEVSFLEMCASWKGRLTRKQQPILQQILERIEERTGLTPPV